MEAVIYFSVVPFLLYVLAALTFWFGVARTVRVLIPAEGKLGRGGASDLLQAQSMAFSAVGMFLLARALPEIGGTLQEFNFMKEMDSYAHMFFETKAHIVELSLRMFLGVLLLFGARGLGGVLIRIRDLGTR